MENKLWKELLEYARWAPSPHNIQAWLFRLESDTEATLLFDPKRLLPGTDPTGRFTAAGFGILLEMMSVAAAAHGLCVQAVYTGRRLDSTETQPVPFAHLTLVPSTIPEPLDHELILQRRTSRLPYNDKPVSKELLQELAAIGRDFGHTVEFSTDPAQVQWVVRLNAETLFNDFAEPVARKEVGGWIRYGMAEARKKADGLAAYALGFPSWLIWLFIKGNFLLNLPGMLTPSRWWYERSMRGTKTVAWISGGFETPGEWDRAGRMLARFWLTMTKHGVYLHPFGSIITNAAAHKQMEEHFYNPARKQPLWLLVRLGHSELPPQAQRLTVEQLLVDGGVL